MRFRFVLAAIAPLVMFSLASAQPPPSFVVQAAGRETFGQVQFSDDGTLAAFEDVAVVEMATGRVLGTTQDGTLDRALRARAGLEPLQERDPEPLDESEWFEERDVVIRWQGPRRRDVAEYRETVQGAVTLRVGRRTVPVQETANLVWPISARFALETVGGVIEIRDARQPARVLSTFPGANLVALAGDQIAAHDGRVVRVASLRSLDVVETPHHMNDERLRITAFGERLLLRTNQHAELVGRDTSVPMDGTFILEKDGRFLLQRGLVGDSESSEVLWFDPQTRTEEHVVHTPRRVWASRAGAMVAVVGDGYELVSFDGDQPQHIPSGNLHSVWHISAHVDRPGEVYVMGRFGGQRWTAEGVLDSETCGGQGFWAVTPSGRASTLAGRCFAEEGHRWPNGATAVALDPTGFRVVFNDGRVRTPRVQTVQLEMFQRVSCSQGPRCDQRVSLRGDLVGVAPMFDSGSSVVAVYNASTGSRVDSDIDATDLALAADGSRYALRRGGGGAVYDAGGNERFTFGHPGSAESPQLDAEVDDDYGSRRLQTLLFGPNGTFYWTPDGRRVEALDLEGAPVRGAHRGARARLTGERLDVGEAVCVGRRFRYVDDALQLQRGPRCRGEERGVVVGGRIFVRDGGLVRAYVDQRVITFGTIRRAVPVHFAYDDRGRWWSSDPSAAPLAVRRGLTCVPPPGDGDVSLLAAIVGADAG